MHNDSARVEREDEGCTCQRCYRQYRIDLIVPNDVWEKIKPGDKPEGAGLLCPSCIILRVERIGGFAAYKLVEI